MSEEVDDLKYKAFLKAINNNDEERLKKIRAIQRKIEEVNKKEEMKCIENSIEDEYMYGLSKNHS